MWFKRKVVLLPTHRKANRGIVKNPEGKLWYGEISTPNFGYNYQHLYIISDEEIKEGDWFINGNEIYQCFKSHETEFKTDKDSVYCGVNTFWDKRVCKKIIAATDKPLTLPQPSQSFIEKFVEEYNKGNIITDVMVEYEEELLGEHWCHEETGERNFDETPPLGKVWIRYWFDTVFKLKVNPKDNTITIRKEKDSWSRGEIEALLRKFAWDIDTEYRMYTTQNIQAWNLLYGYDGKKKWIEENL